MSFFSFIIGFISGTGIKFLYNKYRALKKYRSFRNYKPSKEPLWYVEPSTANGEFEKFTEAEPYKVTARFKPWGDTARKFID